MVATVTSATLDTVRELQQTFEARQAGVTEAFMHLVKIFENANNVISVKDSSCQTDDITTQETSHLKVKIPPLGMLTLPTSNMLAASGTSLYTTDFNLSQSSLSDWDTSMMMTNSNGDTIKSCIIATPRDHANHPRLKHIEKLKKIEWDSDIQFVGSADYFSTENEVQEIFVVVTLSTLYKVDTSGTTLEEVGIECIQSLELFEISGFVAISLDEGKSMLFYFHGDLKSTSHLRFLDVFTELFPQVSAVRGADFRKYISTPIFRYLDKHKHQFPGTDVDSQVATPEMRKVKLKEEVKLTYVSEEYEDGDLDDDTTLDSPDAARHEVLRLQQEIAKVSISPELQTPHPPDSERNNTAPVHFCKAAVEVVADNDNDSDDDDDDSDLREETSSPSPVPPAVQKDSRSPTRSQQHHQPSGVSNHSDPNNSIEETNLIKKEPSSRCSTPQSTPRGTPQTAALQPSNSKDGKHSSDSSPQNQTPVKPKPKRLSVCTFLVHFSYLLGRNSYV